MIRVTRSQPAPDCLRLRNSHRCGEVCPRLHQDFLGKCYLCETPITVGTLEVDHRNGRSSLELEFDWNNLFPSCHWCNGQRRRSYPSQLDPTRDEVEVRLIQWIDQSMCPLFAAALPDDVHAANTAAELTRLHNGAHPRAADLRGAIVTHLARVSLRVMRYRAPSSTANDRQQILAELRWMLGPNAPYSALVSSSVRACDPALWDELDIVQMG